MLSMRSIRLKRYTVQLLSPRVTPSHSSSELDRNNKISNLRKVSSSHLRKRVRYTIAALASAATIAILVTIATMIPSMTKSELTTTEDTTTTSNSIFGLNVSSSTMTSVSSVVPSLSVVTMFLTTQATTSTESTTTTSATTTTKSTTMTSETTTTGSTTSTSVTTSTTTESTTTTSATTTTKITTTTSETTTTGSTTSTSVTTTTTTESTTTTSATTTTESTATTSETTTTGSTTSTSVTITTTTESTTTTSETTTTGSITSTSLTTTTTSDSTTTTTTESSTSTSSTTTVSPPCAFRWYPSAITVAVGLNFPIGIVIDLPDTLYVANANNATIQKLLAGNTTRRIVAGAAAGGSGSSANYLKSPSDVAVDSKGNIYVADSNNHRVQLWRVNATTGVTVAGTGSAGSSLTTLYSPRAIAIDQSTDTIYVSDGNNSRIMSFTLNSTVGTIVAGGNGQGIHGDQLHQPRGLEFDKTTNSLIIVNNGAHNVVRWQLGALNWTLIAGYFNASSTNVNSFLGSSATRLFGPWDATVDPFGNLYVADRNNHRVQFFRAGELNATTIAGVTGVSGSNASFLNEPLSVALDNDLNLYVSDSVNDRIQKFICY